MKIYPSLDLWKQKNKHKIPIVYSTCSRIPWRLDVDCYVPLKQAPLSKQNSEWKQGNWKSEQNGGGAGGRESEKARKKNKTGREIAIIKANLRIGLRINMSSLQISSTTAPAYEIHDEQRRHETDGTNYECRQSLYLCIYVTLLIVLWYTFLPRSTCEAAAIEQASRCSSLLYSLYCYYSSRSFYSPKL